MRRTELTKQTAKTKGYTALASATATLLLSMLLTPYLLLAGGPITLYLAYRWFQYRAEWGLRF